MQQCCSFKSVCHSHDNIFRNPVFTCLSSALQLYASLGLHLIYLCSWIFVLSSTHFIPSSWALSKVDHKNEWMQEWQKNKLTFPVMRATNARIAGSLSLRTSRTFASMNEGLDSWCWGWKARCPHLQLPKDTQHIWRAPSWVSKILIVGKDQKWNQLLWQLMIIGIAVIQCSRSCLLTHLPIYKFPRSPHETEVDPANV